MVEIDTPVPQEGNLTLKRFVYAFSCFTFLVVILLIIFPVFKAQVYPVFDHYLADSSLSSEDKTAINNGWTFNKTMLTTVIILLTVGVIIFLLIVAFRRERYEQYY